MDNISESRIDTQHWIHLTISALNLKLNYRPSPVWSKKMLTNIVIVVLFLFHHNSSPNRLAFSILHIERTKGKNWRKRVAVKISFSWEVKYNVSFYKTNFYKFLFFLVHLISPLKPNNPRKKNERINFLCFYWPPSNDNHYYYFFGLCFWLLAIFNSSELSYLYDNHHY